MRRARRLLSMGPAELGERLRQAAARQVDRAGFGPRVGPGPSGRSLSGGLDAFRLRSERFFVGTQDLSATIAALRRLDPEDETRAIQAADAVLAGRLDVFGTTYDIGAPPHWTIEPVSGVRYPERHWSAIDYMRSSVGGEYKVAWEIARQQYLLDLGRAWLYSGEERYAQGFADHVSDFIANNPPGRGIHWSSSLEVAFRTISWIWALHLFRDARVLTPTLYGEILASLVKHGRHIACYLSTYFSPNTHLTGESLALYWLGTVFPELDESDGWRRSAWRTMEEQLPIQVRPDGTYHEQSTAYARYNADFYLHLVILRRRLGEDVSTAMFDRLERGLEALQALTRPDGTTPYLGDDDGGRLHPVDGRSPNDQRAPLATGALLFDRADFKRVAGVLSTEAVWLLGPEALEAYDEIPSEDPEQMSSALLQGGFFVQRDGWNESANMLVVDCGPLGTLNCGHAHADLLSVDVTIAGRPVIVDSGTFTYTAVPEERDRLRAGAAHNGLTIDGSGSSEPGGPFQWTYTSDGLLLDWQVDSDRCYFVGRERFRTGETHDRSVLFLPGRGWVVTDRVDGSTTAEIEVSFHLAPDLTANVTTSGRVEIADRASGHPVASMAWPDPRPDVRVEETQHSPWYRCVLASQVIRVRGDLSKRWVQTTVVGPPNHIADLLGEAGAGLRSG